MVLLFRRLLGMRVSAGGIVIGPSGAMVLIEQHGNSWSFPKGGMGLFETQYKAALREVREETGLTDLENLGKLGSYPRYSIAQGGVGESRRYGLRWRVFYLFISKTEALAPIDLKEVTNARFVTFDEALALLTHPKDREFLASHKETIKARLRERAIELQ